MQLWLWPPEQGTYDALPAGCGLLLARFWHDMIADCDDTFHHVEGYAVNADGTRASHRPDLVSFGLPNVKRKDEVAVRVPKDPALLTWVGQVLQQVHAGYATAAVETLSASKSGRALQVRLTGPGATWCVATAARAARACGWCRGVRARTRSTRAAPAPSARRAAG